MTNDVTHTPWALQIAFSHNAAQTALLALSRQQLLKWLGLDIWLTDKSK